MASLYTASSRARIALFLILMVAIGAVLFDKFVTFGNEQVPRLPQNSFYLDPQKSATNIKYTISKTIEYDATAKFSLQGSFKQFPDVAYVHSLDSLGEKLDTVENARKTVKLLGFDVDTFTTADGGNQFEWKKDNGTKTITFNKYTREWTLDTSFFTNVDALATKKLDKTISSYKQSVASFINEAGFDTKGVLEGVIDLRYAKLGADGIFSDTTKVEEADYVFSNVYRILPLADLKPKNLRPKETDTVKAPLPFTGKVYRSDPRYGSVEMIVSNTLRDYSKDIFRIRFTDFTYTTSTNYAIITPDEAWDMIQSGKGNLMLMQPRGSNYFGDYTKLKATEFTADAASTELAYWESDEWLGAVYPIYVFRGRALLDDGRQAEFVFYVDALKRFS